MADRRVGMLAFGGDVFLFQSKPRDHRKGSEVSFCRMTFDQNTQTFSIRDNKTHLIHRDSAEADVIHCCSALDEHLRQKVPCVLLRLWKKRSSAFKYMLFSISTPADAKLHAEFVLPYEMRDNISILQGPMLIWSHENLIFCTSSQAAGVKEVQISMSIINYIGELPLRERKRVIQGVRSETADVKNVLYFIEDGRTCDVCLIPEAYASVVQCMMVLSAEDGDKALKLSVLAATSMKQLVRFENGLPVDVCPLPFERPVEIGMVYTVRNESLAVVSFSQGDVCAVWIDSLQLAACWSGVRLLLVDDFLSRGSDQMLLVFESSSAEKIDNFLLRDLSGVIYSCGRSDVPSGSDASQENQILTVQALESRLQSGLDVLEDLQRDVQVKERLFHQTLTALDALTAHRKHTVLPPQQEGLVSLWDDDDDDDDDDDGDADEAVVMKTEALKVDRVWQRVIGSSLIIGVALTHADDTAVCDLSVSLAVDSSLVLKTVILPFPDPSSAPGPSAVKKMRVSDSRLAVLGNKFTALAVTDVAPCLSSGRSRFPMMLHYSTERSGSARVSQRCGLISLDLRDVAEGKFHPRMLQDSTLDTDESTEDLQSLLSVSCVCRLLVRCVCHTLADVQLWLQDSMCFQHLAVDPNFSLDPTHATLVGWEQSSPFQALLTVYYREDLHLLHFLSSLRDFLPASHDLQLLRSASPSAGAALALSLETEIQDQTQAVSSVLRCGGGAMGEGVESGAGSQTLEELREAWLREQGRCFERLRPLLDGSHYSGLTEQILHTQMKTDEAALLWECDERLIRELQAESLRFSRASRI